MSTSFLMSGVPLRSAIIITMLLLGFAFAESKSESEDKGKKKICEDEKGDSAKWLMCAKNYVEKQKGGKKAIDDCKFYIIMGKNKYLKCLKEKSIDVSNLAVPDSIKDAASGQGASGSEGSGSDKESSEGISDAVSDASERADEAPTGPKLSPLLMLTTAAIAIFLHLL